ncbi:MAG TPA: tripartite tricarboxylate transporter substrate binding protein [Xanthobacteraceae bacterium]|nr:tripartite tricarboxylate transporter substrate binding protein [Xanthobacteraceae bacterium]
MAASTSAARLLVFCAGLLMAGTCRAAETYPNHPVKIVAPFAAGGPSDLIGRLLADKLSKTLGQQFYVEDHPGAGGNIGMTLVARSAPDGYTILVASSSFTVNPSLYATPAYDPFKDFAPVTLAVDSPNVLMVHPSMSVKTVRELIALLKTNPGKYAIANSGLGTTPMLAAELFKLSFKLDATSVPYNGGAPAVQATLSNQTPIGFATLPPAYPQIVSGNLRALAVTSPKRSPTLPDVPTMAEAGAEGQDSDTMQGVFVPAGTPPEIVSVLNREIVKALQLADVQAKCQELGFDVVADTPEEFAAYIKKEVDRWHRVIVDAKIPQIQ